MDILNTVFDILIRETYKVMQYPDMHELNTSTHLILIQSRES